MPLEIAKQFFLQGRPVSAVPHGNGHINETFLVTTDENCRYILQKMNHTVFRNIPGLMNNLAAVSSHLAGKDPDPRHSVRAVPTADGVPYLLTPEGDYWRVLNFVENSYSPESVDSAEDLAQAGYAFGRFQNLLSDFPAETLTETIPDFHNTPKRLGALVAAAEKDPLGRLKDVLPEYRFFLDRKDECAVMTDLAARGELPVRVTHNDTKLNNVLFDRDTRKPLCVVDLDTVMPGLVANDFGDTVRFGASTAAEDEQDLSRVSLNLDYYRAFSEAFVQTCGSRLTEKEIRTLPLGAKLMTLENGIRFLTDDLLGDVYYHISRPRQNLDRARTQMKLVADMEQKWEEMNRIIDRIPKV